MAVKGTGLLEVAIGGAALALSTRLILLAYFAQLGGTFLTFVVRPDETFQNGNPLLLSERGEFIVKNFGWRRQVWQWRAHCGAIRNVWAGDGGVEELPEFLLNKKA